MEGNAGRSAARLKGAVHDCAYDVARRSAQVLSLDRAKLE
jgi:hypothetical protein